MPVSQEIMYEYELEPVSVTTIAHRAGRLAIGDSVEIESVSLEPSQSDGTGDVQEPGFTANVESRPYQIEAWQAIRKSRTEGNDKALLHLATGLGKTTVAVVDALRFIHEFNSENETWVMPRILFACHQNSILEQAAERFQEFAPEIPQSFYRSSADDSLDAPIVFASMQSLAQNIDEISSDTFDYIIYDEAHHSQARTFKEVIKHFSPSFQLALTATPDRMDGKNIRDLFGHEVYKKSFEQAMAEGWLADVDYHIVLDEAVRDALENDFDPRTLKELQQLFSNESRNQEIAKQIKEEIEQIGLEKAKTIVFCQDVGQADEMAELLNGRPYHSRLDGDEQRDALEAFRSNGLQVITTRDMFNEGVDIPDARLLVFLRSTGSKTIFEQQLGRGLRKHLDKTHVTVLDFVANIERLALIKDMADQLSVKEATDPSGIGEGRDMDESDNFVPESGLAINIKHGEFDFERLAINILEKYNALVFTEPPEGWVTATDVAQVLDTTRATIAKILINIDVADGASGRYSWGGRPSRAAMYYHPDVIESARSLLGRVENTGELVLARTLAKEFGIDFKRFEELAEIAGISGILSSHRGGMKPGKYFTPGEVELLRASPIIEAEVIPNPEAFLSISAIAKQFKIKPPAIEAILANNADIPTVIRRGRTYIDLAAMETIRTQLNFAPEGYISVSEFLEHANYGLRTLRQIMEELEVTPTEYRLAKGGLGLCLSPAQQALVQDHELSQIQPLPEGWLHSHQIKKILNTSRPRVQEAIEAIGIEPTTYYSRSAKGTLNKPGNYFSPQQIKQIADYLGKDYTPPNSDDL